MANALFTIEQIELIRRLRNSGITKEQVAMAFDQMDCLDTEFGKPSTPMCSNIPQYSPMCSPPQTSDRSDRDHKISPASIHGKAMNGFSNLQKSMLSTPHPYSKPNEVQCYSWPHSSSNSSCEEAAVGGMVSQNGYASSSSNVTSSSATTPSSDLGIMPSAVSTSYSAPDALQQQNHAYSNHTSEGVSSCVPIQCLVNPLDLLEEECYQLEELKQYSWDV